MNVLKTSVPKLVLGCSQAIQFRHINKVFYSFSLMNKECFEIFLRRKIVNLTFLTSRVGRRVGILFKRSDRVGHLGVCLGAEWRIFGALIVECTLRDARFPVWVKSFIASADCCVQNKPFKKHRSENILLDKS